MYFSESQLYIAKAFGVTKCVKQNDKPGYVVDNHLSRHDVAAVLKRPTWSVTGRHIASIRSCFEWGLHVPSPLPQRR